MSHDMGTFDATRKEVLKMAHCISKLCCRGAERHGKFESVHGMSPPNDTSKVLNDFTVFCEYLV